MNKFYALCALVAVVSAQAGPSTPDSRAVCGLEGNKAVDNNNMCWYHECTLNEDGGLSWLPRRCGWMSRVSYNFVQGEHNPCTVNLMDLDNGVNHCNRVQPSVDGPPACATDPLVCQNGGTFLYEADKCWCECPATWQGNHDCSIPTQPITNDLPQGSDICVNGEPKADFCALAGGCLNNGACYNQCDTFWCDCGEEAAKSADHIGKRCEIV